MNILNENEIYRTSNDYIEIMLNTYIKYNKSYLYSIFSIVNKGITIIVLTIFSFISFFLMCKKLNDEEKKKK